MTAVLAEGRPVTVSVYGRPATIEIESISFNAQRALDSSGAQLMLTYSPVLPPDESDRLINLVTVGGVPGGALVIPAGPIDFRITVEGSAVSPEQEQTIADAVQVRLTLPAFPPHPSPGGTFLWLYGLYETDGTLIGFAPVPGQFNADDGTYTGVLPVEAFQHTPFLPAQVGPGYVQNHDPEVHMWSGPTRGAADFGLAGPQFTTFTVVAPQVGQRLFVFSPVVANYGWIDVPGVGPSGPPS
jgi:hypothetical protein